MLKQRLSQKLLQKLSPQQIQMIKLLEIPTVQLEQRIKKELEENPILEEGKEEVQETVKEETDVPEKDKEDNSDLSIDEYIQDNDFPSYKLMSKNYSKDDKHEQIPFSTGKSFQESLVSQLGLRKLSEKEHELANYLIGNIDDDGYMRRDLESVVDDLAFSQNIIVEKEELEHILGIIQEFDPIGVGARDLQECLLIQLRQKEGTRPVKLAKEIIDHTFEEFTKKHYDKIKNKLEIKDEDLKEALDIILHLNPKPGGSYSGGANKSAQVITPDFVLDNEEGKLSIHLNSRNTPELRISRTYADMLEGFANNKNTKKSASEKDTISFVKHKLDSAKWFIEAIKQRHHTLLVTMNAILDYQYEYFLEGDETKLKPMILKDIAEATDLDISTISRVANSKYIQTPYGIIPLKYFFSEGLQTSSGEEVSSRRIKSILKEQISNEDKRKPLTDDKLAKILKDEGYNIARRTVAKYREQLDIPVARLRKSL